jgi:hypothetical protein
MEGRPRYCLVCDYRLDGLAESRCPECGRTFDPADADSVALGRPMGRLGRVFLRPPGRPTALLTLAAAALTLLAAADPAGLCLRVPDPPVLAELLSPDIRLPLLYRFEALTHAATVTAVAAVVLVGFRLLAAAALVARCRERLRFVSRHRWRWAAAPAVAAVVAVCVRADLPLLAGFALAQPTLERWIAEAEELNASPDGYSLSDPHVLGPQWPAAGPYRIGIGGLQNSATYVVIMVSVKDDFDDAGIRPVGGFRAVSGRCYFAAGDVIRDFEAAGPQTGFVHCPSGVAPPAPTGLTRLAFDPLWGGWYRWRVVDDSLPRLELPPAPQ